ncbi:hypothetical protein D3C85_1698030 [compost metagenome]
MRYKELAQRKGLLMTAGSDFHGVRDGIAFHAAIGSRRIGMDVLVHLQSKEQQK